MKFFRWLNAESPATAEEQYGLFDLYKPLNVDLDIVAVHGLSGHFENTWTDNSSQQLWLRDFLPSQLQDIGLEARIMSYGYDSTTAFSKSVTNIEDQALMLLNTLALERPGLSERKRPLIFIAHSLGGIIVKKALVIAHERSSQYTPLLDSVQALVFFAVPHRGSDLAYWSTLAARLLKTLHFGLRTNKFFVEALQRNSPTFADISQSFIERAAPLKIRTFYETEKLCGNLIVDKNSARLGLQNEVAVGVASADHRTICKFNDKDSKRYRPVWKTIQALCAKTEEVEVSTTKQSKPLFVVPFPRDPHFLGREDVISLMDVKFKSERRIALTGIGGVGKSQIAIEYCYRFRDRYPTSNIIWIHAGTKERFEQAFKALARQRKLPGWDHPAINPLDLVYDWLSGDGTWLMILDNADDRDVFFNLQLKDVARGSDSQPSTVPLVTYLPQTSRGGSILITSRNRDTAFRLTNSATNLFDVPYMSEGDAIALLCKKLPDDRSTKDEKTELVKLLEYLPLAITQAAAYISVKRTRMTVAKYSDFLKDNEGVLLDDMGDLRRDPTMPSSVLLTWHISFDKISHENQRAADLLSLISVFDRQGIPQALLQDEDEDDLGFEKRLAPLEEFSLIVIEDCGRIFQMHRLVQVAIRSWLERHREIERWKQNATERISQSLPDDDHRFWKTWESLLPHSEVVLSYLFLNPHSQIIHAKILLYTARYLVARGKYETAKERCQRALNIQVSIFGEDDVTVARSLLVLGEVKRRTGYNCAIEMGEAEAITRRALEIFERALGKDGIDTMTAWNHLALVLLLTSHDGKIEEATNIFRSLLATQEQRTALEEPRTVITMQNLALALGYRYKYKEAETLHRRALDAWLRISDERNPRTITSIANLAHCLSKQGSYKEAEELAQRALALRTSVLGEEHPDTLDSMQVLSFIYRCRGKVEESERLCRRALALCRALLGEGSQQTMRSTCDLKDILEKQRRYSEAEELCQRLVDTHTIFLGPDHPQTMSSKSDLIRISQIRGEREKTKKLLQELPNRRSAALSNSELDRFLSHTAG